MKPFTLALMLVYLLLDAWTPIEACAQTTTDAPQNKNGAILKWLGNAGWEIRAGKTVILIDPFLTRQTAKSGLEWKTDEDAVLKVV